VPNKQHLALELLMLDCNSASGILEVKKRVFLRRRKKVKTKFLLQSSLVNREQSEVPSTDRRTEVATMPHHQSQRGRRAARGEPQLLRSFNFAVVGADYRSILHVLLFLTSLLLIFATQYSLKLATCIINLSVQCWCSS
jgi:hypothetical protein